MEQWNACYPAWQTDIVNVVEYDIAPVAQLDRAPAF